MQKMKYFDPRISDRPMCVIEFWQPEWHCCGPYKSVKEVMSFVGISEYEWKLKLIGLGPNVNIGAGGTKELLKSRSPLDCCLACHLKLDIQDALFGCG